MEKVKKVLSIQTSQEFIQMLKDVCEHEGRSQAKQIENWIKREHKALKLDKK